MDPNRRYWFEEVGFNYRMTNIAAAIGVAQLERFEQLLERRREIGSAYTRRLQAVKGPELPVQRPETRRVDWLYTILVSGFSTE